MGTRYRFACAAAMGLVGAIALGWWAPASARSLAATDVLDITGPPKSERAVFLLINVGALALTGASLVVYQVFRGYKHEKELPAKVPVRIQVSAQRVNGERDLTLTAPVLTYTMVDGDLKLHPENSAATTVVSWRSDAHQTVLTDVKARLHRAGAGDIALESTSDVRQWPDGGRVHQDPSVAHLGRSAGRLPVAGRASDSRHLTRRRHSGRSAANDGFLSRAFTPRHRSRSNPAGMT